MQLVDFKSPTRQSSKGIIVIFLFNAFKFFKRFFVIFVAVGVSLSKKAIFLKLTPYKIVAIVLIVLLLLLLYAILKYLNFKFYLSNDDFHLTTGIFNKDVTVIPKSKIQNVYIKQNFIQQLIQVVSLNIETAGDNKSEIEISALDKPTALQLKKELFSYANDVQEVIDAPPSFFKVSPKRLILEGISQNHLKSFAVVASFLFGLYYEFKDYFNDLELQEHIESYMHLEEGKAFNVLILNLFFVFLAVLVSVLFSLIKTVIVNFNLEIVENRKTFEINKGLFNKVSLVLTPSRIQNLVIKTNRLKQYFGLHSISVKQAMVNVKQRKNFEVIALEKNQVLYLTKKLIGYAEQDVHKQSPNSYYKRILVLHMVILSLILNIPGVLLFGESMIWFNMLMVLATIIYVRISYAKAYYMIDDDYLVVGSGFIDTTTNIMEIHKIQSVTLKQSIFQQRHGIMSVVVHSASKSIKIPYIKEAHAKMITNFLLFKVESQPRDWM